MSTRQRASEQIIETVTSWPGVEAGPGKRGEFAFKVGGPKEVWGSLFEQGRIDYHPVFPGRPGFGARRIETEADVEDVVALMRLNYERVVACHGLPTQAAA